MESGLWLAAVSVGGYISIWKTALLLVVLLVWIRLLTWVDKDAEAAQLARAPLNISFIAGIIVAFFLFIYVPVVIWISIAILLAVFLAEAGVYLWLRHQKVGLKDLKQQFNDFLRNMFAREKKSHVQEDAVTIISRKGEPVEPPEPDSPEMTAWNALQSMLAGPLEKGAEVIALNPSEGAAAVRFMVDGVTFSGLSIDRAASAAVIAKLKEAAGLDLNEKRKPQTGTLKVTLMSKRYELQLQTAGSTAGEKATLLVNPKNRHTLKIDQLGFDEEQLAIIRQSVEDRKGIVILCAPSGQGLTTLLYAMLRAHDAFLQHIITIERSIDLELEGITQNKLGSTAGEEIKQTEWVTSQEPDVLMISKLEDPKSALSLIKYAETGKRAYIGMRAGSTLEAITIWRKMVGDDKLAMSQLQLVISGRLVRKLCMACKIAYSPEPASLKKLNMDPSRVSKLYQARTQPLRDPKGNPLVCEFCQDMRFKGRQGVYEVFVIDDETRQAVVGGGSVNQLKASFRKQRGKYLQEKALAQVEQGDTSVQEVLRVLRSGEDEEGSRGGGSSGPRPSGGKPPAPAPANA